MKRPRLALAAALLAGGLLAPFSYADDPAAPVNGQGAEGGGEVVDQCYAQGSSGLDDPGYKLCRSTQALVWGAAAACRTPERSLPDPNRPDWCGVFDGRDVSEAQVAAYEDSWVHRALTLQRALDDRAPLFEEQLGHTHNSFNASSYAVPTDGSLPSYYATLTNQDPNQVYSMTDQLRMDIRVLEIDLHWVPSPYGTPATHGYWPTMCHGDGQNPGGSIPIGKAPYVHVGCTYDRPMQDGLAEVRRWLDQHPHEVVVIYLENQLFTGGPVAGDEQAHDTAAGIIADELGSRVYQPPQDLKAGDCASMPYETSRAAIRASGAQVLLVGNCGPGGWNKWVFTRGSQWDESGDPTTYGDKECAADQAAREDHSSFRRFYEESPWLEAMTDATQVLTADATERMVRCGVNIIGFDQLQPFDGRLAALVWSWAKDEPTAAGGGCAVQGADGRFHTADCNERHPFACVDEHLDWHVTARAGRWRDGQRVCNRAVSMSSYGVPPNGYRNAQLAAAKGPGDGEVWVNYARVNGDWTPTP